MKHEAANDVDELLLNARLRDELEPYLDESINLVTSGHQPTSFENEYLASMLAWERAPILPISQWFDPPLQLPRPESLTPDELHQLLWNVIYRLCDQHIVLDFTDHLSDLELYCLIARDILPSPEKKLQLASTYLHWHCLDPNEDPDSWLRYYATAEERAAWAEETELPLPPMEEPRCRRCLPRR